jgi:hypothetical protein
LGQIIYAFAADKICLEINDLFSPCGGYFKTYSDNGMGAGNAPRAQRKDYTSEKTTLSS